MRGNRIVVKGHAPFNFEGIVQGALKPGTVVQIDPTVPLVNGQQSVKVYTRGADGNRPAGPLIVLVEDIGQGKTADQAYNDGDQCFGYIPRPGDELNVLLKDIAGTADDHAAGQVLIVDDTTGKLIATTGTPQSEPFMMLETITDPVADTLGWAVYSGY